jgi:hypothetical protein
MLVAIKAKKLYIFHTMYHIGSAVIRMKIRLAGFMAYTCEIRNALTISDQNPKRDHLEHSGEGGSIMIKTII